MSGFTRQANPNKEPSATRSALLALLDGTGLCRVEAAQNLARRLSLAVNKSPAWTWRYVQSVAKGTIPPSKRMTEAIKIVGSERPAWIGQATANLKMLLDRKNS